MLIPQRDPTDGALSQDAMRDYLQNAAQAGTLTMHHLERMIPTGTPNTFTPFHMPGPPTADGALPVRQDLGFKYEWNEPNPAHPNNGGADANAREHNRWVVHGHSPDRGAPEGERSHDQWIVRVNVNNQMLLDQSLAHPDARVGNVDWVAARALQGHGGPEAAQQFRHDAAQGTHIPLAVPPATRDDSALANPEQQAPRPRSMSM
jgi:hypothetical protein